MSLGVSVAGNKTQFMFKKEIERDYCVYCHQIMFFAVLEAKGAFLALFS